MTNNIENSTLYFSTRDELNDPFEFGVYPSFEATPEQIRRWCEEEVGRDEDRGDVFDKRVCKLIAAASNPELHAHDVENFRATQV